MQPSPDEVRAALERVLASGPFAAGGRASSLLRYLVEQRGLDRTKISAAGYGEERPIVANDTPAHQAQNRRVEIVVLRPSKQLTDTTSTTSTTVGRKTGGARGQGAS